MKEGVERKNILAKTIQRCRFLSHRTRQPSTSVNGGSSSRGAGVPPAGCFAVLVGPEKERFAVRARCANHPLFRALLDEAETEYGFAGCDGPLELPCAVEDFMDVMWEMEQGDPAASPACSGGRRGGRHHLQQQQHAGYQMMMSPAACRLLVAGRS